MAGKPVPHVPAGLPRPPCTIEVTAMNELAKLIMGARSIPEAEKFAGSGKSDAVDVVKDDLAVSYFVFFTTYPGCG